MKRIINLSSYDSSNFIDIQESIEHSKKNLFNINKYDVIVTDVVLYNKLSSQIYKLENYIEEETLEKKYHMNVQLWCRDKYGFNNLYPLILKLNNITHTKDFIFEKVKFFNLDGINKLFTIIQNL